MALSVEQLEVGKTYHVIGQDCCIDIEMEAELTAVTIDSDDEVEALVFGHTKLLNQFYSYTFKEVNVNG